jgi:hypothetical protein
MKLNKEQLVDFLSTAIYGCDWLYCYTLEEEKHLDDGLDEYYLENRCREEKWADRLLAGGTLVCVDYEDCEKEYKLTLKDFENKLDKALYDKEARFNLGNWLTDDYDYYDCNNLLQYIMFGEIVYG